jgi:hypothetical protein
MPSDVRLSETLEHKLSMHFFCGEYIAKVIAFFERSRHQYVLKKKQTNTDE